MKNYEKYADEIKKYNGFNFCRDFVKPHILKSDNCNGLDCIRCSMLRAIWLMEEYEEPEVDWSKVEVDTPILVRDGENTEWLKKHFAKYKDGIVYVWNLGRTSWSAPNDKSVSAWRYAKLIEDEEKHKKSEVNWSEVEVDTPILVKVFEGERWKKRYFAKVEDGFVYAWTGENTSLTAHGMTKWSYAKLAEDEKECKEPEVDWSEVEVGTPILVKHDECDKWSYRYFAKYENGVVYAWHCGCTGWAKDCTVGWNYAKLAENEESK